jgi:heme/copper-type cytochrome/quinol oxidase subunit 2
MLVAVWNLLTIVLILFIIWLTRKEKVTTQAGMYNRAFMIIVAVIQIVLIIAGMLVSTHSLTLQAASFTCSVVLLIRLLLSFKMR